MEEEKKYIEERDNEPQKSSEVVYSSEKDFYKGLKGELRFKAEGLFKKAREKGISIEDVKVTELRENKMEFPGLGIVDLPVYFVMVKGRHLESGQVMTDGKLIDYYNRYQRYISNMLEDKNIIRDDKGKRVFEDRKPKVRSDADFTLTDWERFQIGKNIVEDKEFGFEKTITGACDRVIRKLMGENDWLYPEEARLLDEEFEDVQERITRDREERRQPAVQQKRATERQVNYLKARVKNSGLDPENKEVVNKLLKHSGFPIVDIADLTTSDMSKLIDKVGSILPRVKEDLKTMQ